MRHQLTAMGTRTLFPIIDGAQAPRPEREAMKRRLHPEAIAIALLLAAACLLSASGLTGTTMTNLF